ncbi:hypothetical protein P5487_003075 [Bacillus amyloliquefaciens]|uniref:hypothetical protein n=1 Tax=Bacillus amyloliquefaciens TaxID=1390 RepID=UPI0005EED0CF|nr:hypothetical protein [Bacillus amyloliquefaciens]AOC90088.1 hypothetical protein BARD7_00597 [Bacillus amyloliquefaciens]MDH3089121.1 hypothetical protein [Bacillus amyloliquefaciens]RDY85657.1 hypothetical protein C3733_16370 [Bacillus amyloliquefaciens]
MNNINPKKYEQVLLSKRFSIDEKQLFLIGSIIEFVMSKEFFKSNKEIREYAQFYFDLANEPLRDYLIDSRTLLVARISKIILNTSDFEDIVHLISYHMSFIDKNISSNNSVSKQTTNKSSILDTLLKEVKKNNEINS